MANSNFQDVVVLSSNTLNAAVELLAVGSSAGSKSIVFAQDPAAASALHLIASNPTAVRTAILPDANGTLGYLTAVSAGTTAITNGQVVFGNAAFSLGMNGSTVTANMTPISYQQVGAYLATFSNTQTFSSVVSSATHTLSTTGGQSVSGVRVSIVYPINITYIDPKGNGNFALAAFVGGSWTLSGTLKWWCGLYTISGSTAGVVSSTSNSTSGSVTAATAASVTTGPNISSTFVIDPRFTNITWNVTPGDYMFFTGWSATFSCSITANTTNATFKSSIFSTMYGIFSQPEVSYSVPYWGNGSVSASATSYHLTNLVNSGGTASSTNCPFVVLIGS